MAKTSRELVLETLEFRNYNDRVPRDLWTLPWSWEHYGKEINSMLERFPMDIVSAPAILKKPGISQGDAYTPGLYIDDWGCRFTNIHPGVIGQVKEPLIAEDDWSDSDNAHIPVEWLDFDKDAVNAFCKSTDRFVSCGCCPRPFEQLQFIRTTELMYMDLMDPTPDMLAFMRKMHTFYCDLLERWAETDVDGLNFMDDWGEQRQLLINPTIWRELFKPMYKDFIDIAHRHGKKIFMHSDGYTLAILPDLIELGLDALNTQLFCMNLDDLKQFAGKLTFWGEIDRQHLLPNGTPADIENAVRDVYEHLYSNGGCIAQCEFSAGSKPENVYAVYETWEKLRP